MILIAFGTRPEWIKIKPLIQKLQNNISYKLVCTGQHNELIDHSINQYNIVKLNINSNLENRLDNIVTSILNNCGWLFKDITHVIVQGDTTSALAIALAAFHRKIPIIHLEAGLRSWDLNNPYPEEFNRVTITNMASIHLCPTKQNALNIRLERGSRDTAHVVGNTVLDNLVGIEPSINNQILITLHRRENLDIIKEWFAAIENIAQQHKELEFIFPMHPNPKITKHKDILKNVKVIEPLNYNDFISLLSKCGLVITDSGGIQEEASFLKKKCIVCRNNTERNEGEGIFSELCYTPNHLERIFNETKLQLVNEPCPYGDGKSSEKIFNLLKEII